MVFNTWHCTSNLAAKEILGEKNFMNDICQDNSHFQVWADYKVPQISCE